ncbi:hypothetical protein [Pseudodesulfovibrio tunisiensis]|uniref:hypothetical protein n=1 Tax=Pseudodesulfovibrio tunisiensis TaxID=463192 RepID=UPI001FB398D2|nr:hypothetical protein [Pseudodesulfovibrio tunisiensis]
MKKTSGMTKVSGLVQTWLGSEDEQDVLVIAASGRERYLVDPGRVASELKGYEGEWVEAVGVVRREEGNLHIALRSFYTLDDDDWDDDDW